MSKLRTITAASAICFVGVGLLSACGTSAEPAPSASSTAAGSDSREAGLFSTRSYKVIVSNQTSKGTHIRQHIEPVGAVEAELVSPDELAPRPWENLDAYSTFRISNEEGANSSALAVEVGNDKNLDRITFTKPPFKDPRAQANTKIEGRFTKSNAAFSSDPKSYMIYAQPADRIDPKAAESATWVSPATGRKYVLSFENTNDQLTTLYLRIKN